MLFKSITAAAFALLLIGVGINFFSNRHQQKQTAAQWAERNSLKEIARRSKAEGKVQVRVLGPICEYAGVDMDLDEAVRDYSVVLAEPLTNKSYILDPYEITTWYRFKVIEMLSPKNSVYCYTCAPVAEPPKDLSARNVDEFLIAISGGTVTLNGVEITMDNPALPMFESGKKYLLFVSFTPSGVAWLGAGPTGVFRLDDDEHFEPVSKGNHPLQTEMNRRFNLELSLLKSHLK